VLLSKDDGMMFCGENITVSSETMNEMDLSIVSDTMWLSYIVDSDPYPWQEGSREIYFVTDIVFYPGLSLLEL